MITEGSHPGITLKLQNILNNHMPKKRLWDGFDCTDWVICQKAKRHDNQGSVTAKGTQEWNINVYKGSDKHSMLHRSHVNVSAYVMNNAIQNINQAINLIGPINVLPNGHWTHCLEQRYILVSKPWTSAQAAQRIYFLWTFNQKALLYIYRHAQARPFFFSYRLPHILGVPHSGT